MTDRPTGLLASTGGSGLVGAIGQCARTLRRARATRLGSNGCTALPAGCCRGVL